VHTVAHDGDADTENAFDDVAHAYTIAADRPAADEIELHEEIVPGAAVPPTKKASGVPAASVPTAEVNTPAVVIPDTATAAPPMPST
jgi:hypothetical protein